MMGDKPNIRELSWEKFHDRVYERFGPFELDNFNGELTNRNSGGLSETF